MRKTFGAMVVTFTMGGAAMSLLGGVLGGLAECVALGVVGAGLFGTSYALGGKLAAETSTEEVPRGIKVKA